MIIATSIENAHLYGDIIPSIFRLRHQGFKERQNYDVPFYKGMEYDAYDTPATTYLAWRDELNIVRGCTRLLPTTRPYMIEELWPDTLQNYPLPKTLNVWEASRFCIDKTIPPLQRKRIHGELLCAFQEFGLLQEIDWMIGVMTPPIWRAVFINAGWPIEYLGDAHELGPKEKILTGKMKISKNILQFLRHRFGINTPILECQFNYDEKKSA